MSTLPSCMGAILLTGHGDLDRLEYRRDVPVPHPQPDEVLVRVSAAGINNTDINLRTGWYSPRAGAPDFPGAAQEQTGSDDSGWSGAPSHSPSSRARMRAVSLRPSAATSSRPAADSAFSSILC